MQVREKLEAALVEHQATEPEKPEGEADVDDEHVAAFSDDGASPTSHGKTHAGTSEQTKAAGAERSEPTHPRVLADGEERADAGAEDDPKVVDEWEDDEDPGYHRITIATTLEDLERGKHARPRALLLAHTSVPAGNVCAHAQRRPTRGATTLSLCCAVPCLPLTSAATWL